MKNISFAAILLLIALLHLACTNSKKMTAADNATTISITGKKWKLTELMGQPVADSINGKQPFIQFNREDSNYIANGGCNGLGGKIVFNESTMRIQFKQGMSTMMACNDMAVENGLKKIFDEADNYSVSDSTFSLNKARMAPLARFKIVP